MTHLRTAAASGAVALLIVTGYSIPAWAGDEPTTIGVRNGASERSFALTRTRVAPGPAIIQYTNTGEDPHDVLIQRRGAKKVATLGEIGPGDVSTFPLMWLKRDSTYTLWCSLDGHRESGLEASLKVKRRR